MLVNVKIGLDPTVKDRFEEICAKSGYSPDMVVNLFTEMFVTNYSFSFMINSPEKIYRNQLRYEREKSYARQLGKIVETFPENDQAAMRDKILNDICDIDRVTNFSPYEYFRMRMYDMPGDDWKDEFIGD